MKVLSGQRHNAVLLGAMTMETAREFAVTVKSVFPEANCTVIDKDRAAASQNSEHVNYAFADALHLPFASGSVDSMHADFLVRYIPEVSYVNRNYRGQLFGEVYRTLRPGGILIMKEPLQDAPINIQELRRAGFRSVALNKSTKFKSRAEMEKFMRSSAKSPLPGSLRQSEFAATIVAKKGPPIAL